MPERGLQRSVTMAFSNTVRFGLISFIKILHKAYYSDNNKGFYNIKAFLIVYVKSDFFLSNCQNTTE